jgi:hypothetical protein
MRRLLGVLVMALLLGSQVGTVLVSSEAHCLQAAGCCTPGDPCDASCVACACCPGQFSSFASSVILLEFVGVPLAPASSTASSVVLPLFSTDILHVPKSV